MKRIMAVLLCLVLMMPMMGQAKEVVVLKVAGEGFFTGQVEGFHKAQKDIVIEKENDFYISTEAVLNALITRDENYDIMVINTEYIDAKRIIEKGYALALSGEENVKNTVENMYDFTKPWTTFEGEIYALPVDIVNYEPYCVQSLFDKLNLKIPTTWEALATLVNDWPNQSDEVKNTYSVGMWANNYKQWFLRIFMNSYIAYYEAKGEQLTFDTEEFRYLMAFLDTLTEENDFPEDDYTSEELEPIIDQMNYGINRYMHVNPLLSCPIKGEVHHGAYLKLAIINPNGKNIEACKTFLNYLAAHLGDDMDLFLVNKEHAPVLSEDYKANRAKWEKEKAEIEKQIQVCEDKDRYTLNRKLEEHLDAEKSIELQKYDISPELIEAYQALKDKIVILAPSILSEEDNFSHKIYSFEFEQRFLLGDLDTEGFIKEWENVLQMMILENE